MSRYETSSFHAYTTHVLVHLVTMNMGLNERVSRTKEMLKEKGSDVRKRGENVK